MQLRRHRWRHACGRLVLTAGLIVASFWPDTGFAAPADSGSDDGDLTEYRSTNGVLSVALEAAPLTIHLGDVSFPGLVYNGDYAGPVFRVRPGDALRVHLANHLDEATNLHFHGMQTSPLGNSDNVHLLVPAGKSLDYEVKIPATQPPGLYWYHAHVHGNSEKQVMSGLSGALLVEGFADQFPELAGIRERLFVLKEFAFDASDDPVVAGQFHDRIQTVNGKLVADVALRPGETQLWHLGNQSADLAFDLTLKGHHFRVIGRDGNAATREEVTDVLRLEPAARAEVLVDAGAAGSYDLVSERVPTGVGAARSLHRVVGHVTVAGDPATPIAHLAAFPLPTDLRERDVDARREIIFSQSPDGETFFMNGQTFDMNRVDIRIPLGNVEEWTVRNDSDGLHVFHIHQVAFQVTEINGEPQPLVGYVDTVRVPERGSVRIRMAFTQPQIVGRFMYHCHVLQHEDRGMMAQIEVYDPAKPSRRALFDWLKDRFAASAPPDGICRARPVSAVW